MTFKRQAEEYFAKNLGAVPILAFMGCLTAAAFAMIVPLGPLVYSCSPTILSPPGMWPPVLGPSVCAWIIDPTIANAFADAGFAGLCLGIALQIVSIWKYGEELTLTDRR